MQSDCQIRRAHSCALEVGQAVREFHAAVAQSDMALVLFFCSSRYDLEVLAAEMRRLFGDVPVVGCTTAGEIGPLGCRDHSLSGASFPAACFSVASGGLENLRQFEVSQGHCLAQGLLQRLESLQPGADAENSFALLLIDGLCVREEVVTRSLQNALGRLPLVGGSAGDGLDFKRTSVFFDGCFHSDSAVVALVSTPVPFRLFKTQHFVPTDQRVVVTAADAEDRVVHEIHGWPAAEAYARLVGVRVDQLDPKRYAVTPVVVMIDGSGYVRSIQQANSDGSLTFYCAIEEGVVLRVARGVDLVENLDQAFVRLRDALGRPQLIIGCDCILRKLEIIQLGLIGPVEALFADHNVVGFNSYGEQYCGVHVNQTFTGIAFGGAPLQASGG